VTAALPPEAAGKPVEIWFTDEARVGQQGDGHLRPRAALDDDLAALVNVGHGQSSSGVSSSGARLPGRARSTTR